MSAPTAASAPSLAHRQITGELVIATHNPGKLLELRELLAPFGIEAASAGELGLHSIPAFMFQEGYDPVCEQAFREIARLTRGAYCRFAPGAAHELAELLRAVAAYAAGGMKALAALEARSNGATRLLAQLK